MNHTMTTGIKYGYGLLNKKARDQSFYTEDKNKQIIDQEANVGQEKYQNEKQFRSTNLGFVSTHQTLNLKTSSSLKVKDPFTKNFQ